MNPMYKMEYFEIAGWPTTWKDSALCTLRQLWERWYKPADTNPEEVMQHKVRTSSCLVHIPFAQ